MKLFLLATAVFLVAVLGMAVGVIVGNRRLRGSCGGLSGLSDEHGHLRCENCQTPSKECADVADEARMIDEV